MPVYTAIDGSDHGDVAFVAVCSAMVLLMTPGLAFFYGGLVRAKNVVNTVFMGIVAMGIISTLWVLVGFSFVFGDYYFQYFSFKNLGDRLWPDTKIPEVLFAVFQMTFAIIAAAIISGSVVERMRFGAYVILIMVWLMAVYVPLCHWVWGGGWIQQLGAKDFAGGTVVHISAGTSAYVGAHFLGVREHGPGEPHNVPFVILGGSLLWFGWTGFNGGSALAANLVACLAIANTYLAAAAGMTMWITMDWLQTGFPSSIGAMNGAVAGLVAITPAAGYVNPGCAMIIGLLGCLVCNCSMQLLRKYSPVDDSLDCFGLHGIGGYAGAILLGFFDVDDGLFFGGGLNGGFRFLGVQTFCATTAGLFSGLVTACVFFALKSGMRVRVERKTEHTGVDRYHSEKAYHREDTDMEQGATEQETQGAEIISEN